MTARVVASWVSGSLAVVVAASCAFDWDAFDPRLAGGQGGGTAGSGGAPATCTADNEGAPCGDATANGCDLADSCAAGSCADNLVADGTACGDCSTGLCTCAAGDCLDCDAAAELPTRLSMALGTDGFMFDLVAKSDVRIVSFDAHLNDGTYDVAVYYRAGGYTGFDMDMSAWTLAGTARGLLSNGPGTFTPLPIAVDVVIPAGETYGWYVTSLVSASGDQIFYASGTREGAVQAGDGRLEILEGIAKIYPFGEAFTPRAWSGVVHYAACE